MWKKKGNLFGLFYCFMPEAGNDGETLNSTSLFKTWRVNLCQLQVSVLGLKTNEASLVTAIAIVHPFTDRKLKICKETV